jgi:competence protein ComEA
MEEPPMQDARIRIALIVICLACLLGSGFVLLRGRQSAPPPILFTAPPAIPATSSATTPISDHPKPSHRLYVDVAGAVRRPSLYILAPGSRVMQAVMAAGGPTAAADMDAVNLAQAVTDGEKVFVPRRGIAPVPAPPALPSVRLPMPARATSLPSVSSAAKTVKESGGSRSGKITAESGEQIGINSATLEQLERLPGVGPSMAARILAYRQQSGGFGKVEDLTLVTGIGPKKYAKIAPFVTLN